MKTLLMAIGAMALGAFAGGAVSLLTMEWAQAGKFFLAGYGAALTLMCLDKIFDPRGVRTLSSDLKPESNTGSIQ